MPSGPFCRSVNKNFNVGRCKGIINDGAEIPTATHTGALATHTGALLIPACPAILLMFMTRCARSDRAHFYWGHCTMCFMGSYWLKLKSVYTGDRRSRFSSGVSFRGRPRAPVVQFGVSRVGLGGASATSEVRSRRRQG